MIITVQQPWSLLEKVLFRFFFVFFTLFIFPFPLNYIPHVGDFFNWYSDIWTPLVNWIGRVFFDLNEELNVVNNGSGDHLYDYLQSLSFLMIAFLITIFWSLIDRRRSNYITFQKWFVMILTYYLASILFIYGISKVFYMQFSRPGITRLLETYGNSSPMRIMWTFMGASEFYTKFSGWMEVLAGSFLLFRRTRTLGGLATFSVMLNVFILNLSYDVPVKLFSFLLLLMGAYVVLLDFKRIIGLLFTNKSISNNYDTSLPLKNKTGKLLVGCLQIIFISYLLYLNISSTNESRKTYGDLQDKPGLYGLYKVTNYVRNNDSIPPLVTDSLYWKYMFVDYRYGGVKFLNDKFSYYKQDIDTVEQNLTFLNFRDTTEKFEFVYYLDGKKLSLEGVYESDTLSIDLEY